MRQRFRLLAGIIALLLLTGCVQPGSTPEAPLPQGTSVQSGDICYVPLDDRPDNWERVVYLAESLGYNLLLPEEDWFSTTLDSQPPNAHGTQYGHRAALYEWVMAQEATGCDRYILFVDQLTSGGLVNSRHMSESLPITLSDGTALTEAELLERLMTTLAADENNAVWLLDTVMRLAPTVGYDSFGLAEYTGLRSFGIAGRPVLTGSQLTVENIVADYPLAADGSALPVTDFDITADMAENYFAARERKLRLSAQIQSRLTQPGYERFRLLVGIDDSSEADSIQRNEIAFLRQGLREGDALLSGVDDLAFKAVTRLYLNECVVPVSPSAAVEYFGGTEDQPACDYDYQSLNVIVDEHLAYFGMTPTDSTADADIRILVLTQPKETGKKAVYCRELITALQECEKNLTPVILIDAGNGTYGTQFHDMLVKDTQLGYPLSYSGFLDMAIVSGTAISHGIARYAWLANGNGLSPASNAAFCKTMIASVVLDLAYKNDVRLDVIDQARKLGGDPNNFYAPAIDLEKLGKTLSDGMAKSAKPLLKNLAASHLLIGLDGSADSVAGWGDITLTNWRFPWNRAFEVRMDIGVSGLTAASENSLKTPKA